MGLQFDLGGSHRRRKRIGERLPSATRLHCPDHPVQFSLGQRAGLDIRSDDEVDAFWLRQAGLVRQGHPDALSLPKTQTAVLDGIAWPEGIES